MTGFWWVQESAGPGTAVPSSASGLIGEAGFTQETFCHASMATQNRVTKTFDKTCVSCHCSQRLWKCAAGLH